MNPQDYMQRLAGLSALSPAPGPPAQQKPGYWWNDQRVPETKPMTERFAGGQNKAKFTPFQGDITRYGMGAQHRFYQTDPETYISTTTGTNTTNATTADPGTWQQQNGGPDGGQSDAAQRDGVHGKSFDQMSSKELGDYAQSKANGSFIDRNMASIAGFAGPLGMGALFGGLENSQLAAELAGRGMSNPGDFVGGNIAGAANTGMNVAGGVANPELAGRSDPSQAGGGTPGGGVNANDLGAELAAGNTTGNFAEGGVVPGDAQPGVDDVTINADGGEGIIRAKPMTALGEPFLDALNTEDYALAYRLLGEIVGQSKRDATENAIVAKRRGI